MFGFSALNKFSKNILMLLFLLLSGSFGITQAQSSAPTLSLTPLFGDFSFNSDWQMRWGTSWVQRTETAKIMREAELDDAHSLVVSYLRGAVGPDQGGLQFPAFFAAMPDFVAPGFDELYLRYRVYFEPGFDFVKGGKLPGLMGGGDSWARSGGNQPSGENGWTLRFMWREQGKVVVYSYLPQSANGKYGNQQWGLDLPLKRHFTTGKWHTIEQRVKINEVGQQDGELTVWFDGEQVLHLDDVTYRTADNEHGKIGGVYFSTFHGGNESTWAPALLSKARFSDFAISGSPIGAQ